MQRLDSDCLAHLHVNILGAVGLCSQKLSLPIMYVLINSFNARDIIYFTLGSESILIQENSIYPQNKPESPDSC